MLGFNLGAAHGLKIGLDEGFMLVSLECSMYGSNDGKREGLLLGVLLGFSDGLQQQYFSYPFPTLKQLQCKTMPFWLQLD